MYLLILIFKSRWIAEERKAEFTVLPFFLTSGTALLSNIPNAFSPMLSTATIVIETQTSFSELLLRMIIDVIIDPLIFALKCLEALLKARTQLY